MNNLTKDERDKLVVDNMKLAYWFAWRYSALANTVGLSSADLAQPALMGMMEAAKRYEKGRNAKFSTYAGYWIKRGIRKTLKESTVVRVPMYTMDSYVKNKHPDVIRATAMALSPTTNEIPERSDDDGHRDYDIDPAPAIRGFETLLSNREKRVLYHRLALGGTDESPLSLDKVGAMIGLTREGARHVEKMALAKLRAFVEAPSLSGPSRRAHAPRSRFIVRKPRPR